MNLHEFLEDSPRNPYGFVRNPQGTLKEPLRNPHGILEASSGFLKETPQGILKESCSHEPNHPTPQKGGGTHSRGGRGMTIPRGRGHMAQTHQAPNLIFQFSGYRRLRLKSA